MATPQFLALDLGAESGRAVLGGLEGGRLSTREVHRFANEPVEMAGTRHWDFTGLYRECLRGLHLGGAAAGGRLAAVGVDGWSVDFGLLGADGSLLQEPVQYRDRRTEGMVERALERISGQRLYELTGMAPNQIHTLFQMLALKRRRSPLLRVATDFLMVPDLVGYLLSGRIACERTNASHTNLYDPRTGRWAEEVFAALELPAGIMPELVDPGTVLEELRESVAAGEGLAGTKVVAPCTHDTASAVAAIPARGEDWAFLSSGTWSIVGTLVAEPVSSPEALAARVNNELGLEGPFACRNIMGLWLLQQSRAAWAKAGAEYDYGELAQLAEAAPPGGPLVYPDDPAFLAPEDMSAAIGEYCRRTGQEPPEGPGPTARCVLESLALCYRETLEQIAGLTGRRFSVLHVVGGGSQNEPLCRLTATACGVPLLAGPVEATVAGNLLVQALALGHLSSGQEVREVVRASSELREHEPRAEGYMQERWEQYRALRAEHQAG